MSGLSTVDGRQKDFVRRLSLGEPPQHAAEAAGYAPMYAYQLLTLPHIVAALHVEIQRRLQYEAAASLKVLVDLRDDKKTPNGIRADIGLQLMKMAGHVVPSNKQDGPAKQLSEMTREEMIAYIDRNQAEIDKAVAELAERAKPVNAQGSAQEPAHLEAKPLTFLD